MIERDKYKDITEKILRVAFEVHRILKNGFAEIIYHRAMMIEARLQGLDFISEYEAEIFYKTVKIGTRRVDLYFENTIPVELKATNEGTLPVPDTPSPIKRFELVQLKLAPVGVLVNI